PSSLPISSEPILGPSAPAVGAVVAAGTAVAGMAVGATVGAAVGSVAQPARAAPAALIAANWRNSRLFILLSSDIGILLISKLRVEQATTLLQGVTPCC